MTEQELREKIDKIYSQRGRLNINNGIITLDDKGWEEFLVLIKEASYVKPPESMEITELAEIIYNFKLDIKSIKANIQNFLLANHYVQFADDQSLPLLFHKILGNEDNPSPDRLAEAKNNIKENGLIARLPDEWKHLLPEHLQSVPVVWLIGYDRMVTVNKSLLDKDKLVRLDSPEVDWWVYAGNIPPEALRHVRQAGGK